MSNLHIHTWCSTGTQAPEEVIQEAVSKGIGLISITDDDTMDAYVGLEEIAIKYAVIFKIPSLDKPGELEYN